MICYHVIVASASVITKLYEKEEKRVKAKENEVVRQTLKENHVYQWELAERLGVAEYTLTRMLRHELNTAKQNELCEAIKAIAGGRDKG